jgi:hypothetical protein
MKTLLFVLLVTALSVQDDVAERVQLSKIKDVEKAKSNKHSRKNNPALSIVGADLRVCPGRGVRRDTGAPHAGLPLR